VACGSVFGGAVGIGIRTRGLDIPIGDIDGYTKNVSPDVLNLMQNGHAVSHLRAIAMFLLLLGCVAVAYRRLLN